MIYRASVYERLSDIKISSCSFPDYKLPLVAKGDEPSEAMTLYLNLDRA